MTGCSPFNSSFFSHRDATNQKLKIAEAAVRNQDKKAIMADNWYLPQNLGEHWDPWNCRRRSITAALEQAAANERIDSTCEIQEMVLYLLAAAAARWYPCVTEGVCEEGGLRYEMCYVHAYVPNLRQQR